MAIAFAILFAILWFGGIYKQVVLRTKLVLLAAHYISMRSDKSTLQSFRIPDLVNLLGERVELVEISVKSLTRNGNLEEHRNMLGDRCLYLTQKALASLNADVPSPSRRP